MKGGKSGPENIVSFYYQIAEVFKSVLSVRQHAQSKDDRK